MSATVAPGCDHATGALAPKSSSQPNASALPPLFQLIGNLVDSGLHALLIDAIVESVCAIGGFFQFCIRPREWMIGGFLCAGPLPGCCVA